MIGLVLQGGGARGSYHIGAIEALMKRNIKFNTVVGTSIGAINGALVAAQDFNLMKKLWSELDTKSVFEIDMKVDFSWESFKKDLNNIKKLVNNKGIDITKFTSLLQENINETKLRKSNIDFGLTTYNLTDKKMIEIFKKDIPKGKLVEYLIASAYLPVFKMNKIIDGKYYLDGGAFNNCPLSMLETEKYEKIYIIKIYKNETIDKELKKNNVVLIAPNENLGSQINFTKEITNRNIKLGYYDTLKVLDNLDGKKYYIKYKNDKYYESLFNERDKKMVLFETAIYKGISEKKIILKILESLCIEYKIERFKIYSIKSLITLLKVKMINAKSHKYYKFINKIKII